MQMKLYKTFKNANLYKIPVKNMKSPVAVFSSKAHFPVRGTSNTAESFIFTQPEQLKFFLQHLAIMISTTDIFWHFHIPQTPSSFVHRSCKYTSKDGLVWDHNHNHNDHHIKHCDMNPGSGIGGFVYDQISSSSSKMSQESNILKLKNLYQTLISWSSICLTFSSDL